MNDRTKIIVLASMFVILLITAVFVIFRPLKKGSKARKAKEAAAEVAVEQSPLPAPEDLEHLVNWFVDNADGPMVAQCADMGVFGLQGTLAVANAQGGSSALVPSAAQFVPPPRLDGVICSGNQSVALFNGDSYRPGQKIRNTSFLVVEIGQSSVKVRSEEGRELSLDLLN